MNVSAAPISGICDLIGLKWALLKERGFLEKNIFATTLARLATLVFFRKPHHRWMARFSNTAIKHTAKSLPPSWRTTT